MNQDRFLEVFGEIEAKLGLRSLRKVLSQAGLKAEVRESANYQGGRYLHVADREELILEQVSNGRYLLHADAAPASQICHAASRLSRALSDAGIRHRLEVYYEGTNELVHYSDHHWPLTDESWHGPIPGTSES
jgi:hypothetical protein